MKLKWNLVLVIASILLVVSVGCKKAPPETPADTAPAAPTAPAPTPAEDVRPAPAPSTDDREPSPLDAEIVEADNYARSGGLIGDVFFDFDKYELTSGARDQLEKNASFLKSNGSFVVTIEGHCDERGTSDYNIALGDRRANAAKDYLVSLGVSGARVKTLSYGEEKPRCTQSNESCWSQNRRGEFHLTGRM